MQYSERSTWDGFFAFNSIKNEVRKHYNSVKKGGKYFSSFGKLKTRF